MSRVAPGRLPGGDVMDRIFREGTTVGGPLLALRWVAALGCDNGTRVGFAVGKRMAPRAVDRNRLRRRIRALVRASGVPSGLDLVVVARPPALDASSLALAEAWSRALEAMEARL